MSGDPYSALMLLVGALAFTAGGLLGGQAVIAAFRRRDQRLAEERRVLNRIWGVLREDFGVDKAPWMAAALERKRLGR